MLRVLPQSHHMHLLVQYQLVYIDLLIAQTYSFQFKSMSLDVIEKYRVTCYKPCQLHSLPFLLHMVIDLYRLQDRLP